MAYYRVTTRAEFKKCGAGLGYEELYGDEPRYYRDKATAQARADALNQPCDDASLEGTYFVEEREDGQDIHDLHYVREIEGMTVREALSHVDDGELWTPELARKILVNGWSNGEAASGQEVEALECLARGDR